MHVVLARARAPLLALLLLTACGAPPPAPPLATAVVRARRPAAALAAPAMPTPTLTLTPTLAPTPTLTPTPTPATALEQYRAWMEEARALHPYPEPVEVMWAVMLCESSGNAGAITGPYHGLFQYLPATWAGDWNPYRDQPILDARAQIFATAKAWQDGYQGWWGCYGR